MNAIQLLRQMHADTKVRFKLILGADDPKQAAGFAAEFIPAIGQHRFPEREGARDGIGARRSS